MQATGLKVNPSAAISMDSLTATERQQLVQAVEQIQGKEPSTWPKELVARLTDAEPLYLLRFTPDLRAFITRSDTNEIEILDLVHRKTLQLFRSQGPNGGVRE